MFWQTKTSYEFGRFRVDTRERRLLRDGEVVALTPKVFDILLALVQNSGHILSKDEVMKLVWPDSAVEEGSIARNISTLRKALGESPDDHQYVETVPWRGYRFVANVSEVHDQDPGRSIDSIAVLPFRNDLDKSDLEYLSDGITESLIGTLAQFASLKVMSRNSVFRYKGREVGVQMVARELKVRAVLIGRVTERDKALSISVELVDGLDGSRIWGAQYGREITDIASLPESVAREIADKLRLRLRGEEQRVLRKRYTENGEAYQNYLKGRYYFHKLTPEGVQKGIEYFRRAIEQDATYALAYAGLGDCYTYLAKSTEASEAFVRALELDQTLGEAHASLGFFKFLYNWDWNEAEEEFLQAIDLMPNYAEAHHWYAIYLANMGRHSEALREAECARDLDPLSLLMNMTPGLTSYLARSYDEAIEAFQKVIEMEPNFMAARSMLGSAYEQKGHYEKAIAEYTFVLETFGENADVKASIKALLARAYDSAAAEDAVQETLTTALQSHEGVCGSEQAWLVGILKQKIIDECRRIGEALEIHPKDYLQHDKDGPFEPTGRCIGHWRADLAPSHWHLDASTLKKEEFWRTLDRCLSQMQQAIAMAFVLKEVDGLSPDEICDVMNISRDSLALMLHCARLKVRSSLEAEWFRGESRYSGQHSNRPGNSGQATEFPPLEQAVKRAVVAA